MQFSRGCHRRRTQGYKMFWTRCPELSAKWPPLPPRLSAPTRQLPGRPGWNLLSRPSWPLPPRTRVPHAQSCFLETAFRQFELFLSQPADPGLPGGLALRTLGSQRPRPHFTLLDSLAGARGPCPTLLCSFKPASSVPTPRSFLHSPGGQWVAPVPASRVGCSCAWGPPANSQFSPGAAQTQEGFSRCVRAISFLDS